MLNETKDLMRKRKDEAYKTRKKKVSEQVEVNEIEEDTRIKNRPNYL